MKGNSNGVANPSLGHHGKSSGRLPELENDLGTPPILERPASTLTDFESDIESDEVVVHDEDCIVDESSEFPMIRFSDRVHDKVDCV
ncbi:hypothetical protein V6N11_012415 [Hibiscus sabdariffa]|uniref:Uncharacterized protein n=1 Tax=Hibiscus sabdariffa TaxID=183260 RepID=A0ABR2QBD5_9ROSI